MTSEKTKAALHMAATSSWEHFRHDADVGIRGYGSSPAAAFEQIALALTAVMIEPADVALTNTVTIEVKARNLDLMLFDWLNALIFEMATRRMIFGAFEVTIKGHRLIGQARGEAISRERHQPAVEAKGATMTELSVAEVAPNRWCAQCVVDV